MGKNIWDGFWSKEVFAQLIEVGPLEAVPDKRVVDLAWLHEVKAEGDRLNTGITQLRECLGEYESKEWCGHCILDSKCAQITMYVNELEEKVKTVLRSLEVWKGLIARTQFVNEVAYMMVEVSITAIQQEIDLLTFRERK